METSTSKQLATLLGPTSRVLVGLLVAQRGRQRRHWILSSRGGQTEPRWEVGRVVNNVNGEGRRPRAE